MQASKANTSYFKGGISPLGINTKFARTAPNAGFPAVGPSGIPGPGQQKPSWFLTLHDIHQRIKAKKDKKKDWALKFRAWLAMRQREEIKNAGLRGEFKSLCSCGQKPIPKYVKSSDGGMVPTGAPGVVQLAYYEKGDFDQEGKEQLAFAWVRRCGSPMLCFMDAPKIRYRRSQELQDICRIQIRKGRFAYFLTFTTPHDLTTDPRVQTALFQEAVRLFKSAKSWDLGKSWAQFAQKFGYLFQVRCIEMTDDSPTSDRRTGCHFHHHNLWFVERELMAEELEEAEKYLKLRWFYCLREVGLCTDVKKDDVLAVGLRLDVPRKPKDEKATLEDIAAYIAKGASMELTPGIFAKNGRIPNRVSHWQVMALAFTRFPALVPRALKMMQALKGLHWIHFDKKLLEDSRVKIETEEEILEEKLGATVLDIDADKWAGIDKYKSAGRVLENIQEECAEQGLDLAALKVQGGKLVDSKEYDKLWEIAAHAVGCVAAGYDSRTGESLEELTRKPPDY